MQNKHILLSGLLVWVLALFSFTLWMQTNKSTQQTNAQSSEPQIPDIAASDWPEPPDFDSYVDVKQKKRAFFSYLYPMVVHSNQKILQLRKQIQALSKQKLLTDEDTTFIEQLAEKYKVSTEQPLTKQLQKLLVKVDILPPSLVLAQAANESSWGTSRFATQANNFFGQWCFRRGCGLVPESRDDEAIHEVAKFKTVFHSVQSYMLNLNRHPAYKELRMIRHQLKKQQQPLIGSALAQGLESYSERGEDYVAEINQMIRYNKLERLYPIASTSALSAE